LPCRPRTPEHKGKVERGIAYVKGNALKGRTFETLAAQNTHLLQWEKTVADTRVHGTTRQQVLGLFAREKPHLQALPQDLFVSYREMLRRVGRDSYVQVDKAYYQTPTEYIGHEIWAQVDGRSIRLFNQRHVLIASHLPLEPGRFSRIMGVGGIDPKGAGARTAAQQWINLASRIGPQAHAWAEGAWAARGLECVRSLMGLYGLASKHRSEEIERACAAALSRPTYRLRDVQSLLIQGRAVEHQELLPFDTQLATPSEIPTTSPHTTTSSPATPPVSDAKHPLIRDLQIYTDHIAALTSGPPTTPDATPHHTHPDTAIES
jgi:hypothetical protein